MAKPCKPVRQRTYQLTVLYSTDDYPDGFDPAELSDIAYATDDGPAIGGIVLVSDDEVAPENVEAALGDIGNDGSFFDGFDDEPTEGWDDVDAEMTAIDEGLFDIVSVPVVPVPVGWEALDAHMREMHGTIVHLPWVNAEAEHDGQHAVAAAGRRDPGDLWTPHTHEPTPVTAQEAP